MQVLLVFLLVVAVGAAVTAERDQPQRRLPLLGLCVVVAGLLFSAKFI